MNVTSKVIRFATALSFLTACLSCGGGGVATQSNYPLRIATGTVSELGATHVLSTLGDGPAQISSTNFSVSSSAERCHLLYAVNSAGEAIGICVAIPGQVNNISPDTTAEALVFSAPGIYTPDPTLALARINEIKSMPSFGNLKLVLEGNAGNLVTLFSNSSNAQLVATVISDWFQNHPSSAKPLISRDTSRNQDLILSTIDSSNAARVGVHFENADLRVLQIVRKSYYFGGQTTVEQLPDMAGAEGASLIGLILQTIGTPSTADYIEKMSLPNGAYRVDYFFRGFGSQSGILQAIPADVTSTWRGSDSLNSATVKTVFWYLILPILDSVSGFGSFLTDSDAWTEIIDHALNSVTFADDLQAIIQSFGQSKTEIASSMTKAGKDLLQEMIQSHEMELLLKKFFKSHGLKEALKVAVALDTIQLHAAITLGLNLGQLIGLADEMKDWHAHNEISVTNEGIVASDYPDFLGASGLTVNGATSIDGPVLSLVPASEWTAGSAFLKNKISVAGGFDTIFNFRISGVGGTGDTPGADGFAFLIQNEGDNALGGLARDIGFGGITNSLAVEFDTYKNAEFGDPSSNHIGIMTRGLEANSADHQFAIKTVNVMPVLNDGNAHMARIKYDGSLLQIYLDNTQVPILSANVNLGSTLQLDGGKALLGFTSSTGSSFQNVDILSWQIRK